ncbi:MAG: hypothetical protein AABM67_13840 [Acidobacteriota bacterium]
MLTLAPQVLRTGEDGTWYYDDTLTWVTGVLVLAWLVWFFVRRYLRARKLRRRPRQTNYRLLKRTEKIKRKLSSQYLQPGFSGNIHAVGIGRLGGGGDYCIQVFFNDANEELWTGSGVAALPNSYLGVPVVPIEMSMAGFLSTEGLTSFENPNNYPKGIRETQAVIVGGISGANTNLTGQSGTIGYFCTRKSKWSRRKDVHMLSNSHVFADLRRQKVDDTDLIMQPSPGEPGSNRPIGTLVNFSTLKLDGGIEEPNHVDAAIAKLWSQHPVKPLIPLIGAVKGYVVKQDIELGEATRKFGRTTGYTEGRVFSICLDIWIRYDRTGQLAFFQNQLLIEPAMQNFPKFVAKGDSGSLVVDAEQDAIGLIFAGMSDATKSTRPLPMTESTVAGAPVAGKPRRIEGYGVANPISEVMDRMKIELLV